MKRFFIAGELNPQRIIENWKWVPEVRKASWPALHNGDWFDLEYVDIKWLGVQISFNNERD